MVNRLTDEDFLSETAGSTLAVLTKKNNMNAKVKKITTLAGVLKIVKQVTHKDVNIIQMDSLETRTFGSILINSEVVDQFREAINEFMPPAVLVAEMHFSQGYICALATIIRSHGIDTGIREAFKANRITKQQIRDYKIDETDSEIILKHWDELNK